jgi:cysteine-rich repeat protein
VQCSTGRICPAGNVCDVAHQGCALTEQVTACAGKGDVEPCSYGTVTNGICDQGICLPAGCGNSIVDGSETCDDGNRLHGDGCSADCLSSEVCGNGIVDATKGEACDDGNVVGGDTCQPDCLSPRCGDGVQDMQYNEGCDDGALNSSAPDANCRENCQLGRCGDAVLDSNEICDDGNNASNDGCRFDCLSDETCGNGTVDFAELELCDDSNGISQDGCGGCLPESAYWFNLQSSFVFPRMSLAMAYDGARGRVVLFGGDWGSFSPSNDTWEWDGATWRQLALRATTLPPPRRGHVMAYDAARRVVVLFGGQAPTLGLLDDTWIWDGTTWKDVTPLGTKPTPREFATMAYDPVRKRVLLFGGKPGSAGFSQQTWSWDGAAWTDVTPASTNPDPRANSAMTYDPVRDRIVLHGGKGSVAYNDTWEWNGSAWADRTPASGNPAARLDHALAYDPVGGKVVMHGGFIDGVNVTNETWEWNGTSWSTSSVGPTRYGHAMAHDVTRGRIVLFGGNDLNGNRSETYERVGTTWSDVSPVSPGLQPIARHALAYDASRGNIVMFGGEGIRNGGFLPEGVQETRTWSQGRWELRTPAAQPYKRARHAMAYDGNAGVVVLFGGEDPLGPIYADTWTWNGTTWADVTPGGSPDARYSHAMAYDAVRHQTLMFGGRAGSPFGDTWQWNGSAWNQYTGSPSPQARYGHAIAYDARRDRIVMFGGYDTADRADTWEWNGTGWTDVTPAAIVPGPSARHFHAMAYDARRGRVVLFGGWAGNAYVNDAWEWDGTRWLFLDLASRPNVRYYHAMAYHSLSGDLLVVAGEDGVNGRQDTWLLRYENAALRESCHTGIDGDRDGAVGCDDDDCFGVCAPLCYPGSACASAMPRCGDATCQPVESKRSCPADCGTPPVRCGDQLCESAENAASCPGDCTP